MREGQASLRALRGGPGTAVRREEIAVIAPSLRQARTAAARRNRPRWRLRPFSLEGFLASRQAPSQIIVCPAGRDAVRDCDFLREVKERLLWPAPDRVLYAAIAGLLTHLPPAPLRRARGSRRRTALLLEGAVTPARARKALEGDSRHWVVETARRVRLGRRDLAELARRGVRWSALQPVRVIAALVSPELAHRRSRWKRCLPAKTPVWIL
jgi:hypothetical protein